MDWYVAATILGIIAPWVVMGRSMWIAFAERGLLTGLGQWFGIALVTTPIVIIIWWIARLVI